MAGDAMTDKRSSPIPLNNRAPEPETRTPSRAEAFRKKRDCGCGKTKAVAIRASEPDETPVSRP